MTDPALIDPGRVREQLLDLQGRVCRAFEAEDGEQTFHEQRLEGPDGSLHRPRVLEDGPVLEKAAVQFSHVRGRRLPEAATAARPQLTGRDYQVVSMSLIVHPRNPYVPTSHANFRFFLAEHEGAEPVWWFGGGFDLTPYYGFVEDAVHWHHAAEVALAPHGVELYPRFKANCDRYFRLPHRDEARGIGGVFYDDFDEGGFERCFDLHSRLGEAYLQAYLPILRRRRDTPYGDRERGWQLARRGRYVEFNLLHDRGTRFGLQAGGNPSSILASLPPLVRWPIEHEPEPGTPEHELLCDFLRPRPWAEGG